MYDEGYITDQFELFHFGCEIHILETNTDQPNKMEILV
jgi:hypothetical protein